MEQYAAMVVGEEDLTASARIRNAALAGFAQRGVAATSIRDVARAAGVSPGLVQHHFGTKERLRRAVDEHVEALVATAIAGVAADELADPLRELGDRIAGLVRDHPEALTHVARSVAEGDAAGLALFERFVALGREQWRRLAEAGRLREDVDLEWAALHIVIFNLGTALFEPGISRVLGQPFAAQVERWNEATRSLIERETIRRGG